MAPCRDAINGDRLTIRSRIQSALRPEAVRTAMYRVQNKTSFRIGRAQSRTGFHRCTGLREEAADADFFMDVPSGNDGSATFAIGVNSGRDIVGYSFQGWFAPHLEGTNDASEAKPKFIPVKVLNSQFSIPFGINDHRGVVGTYADSTGKLHGFLAKPELLVLLPDNECCSATTSRPRCESRSFLELPTGSVPVQFVLNLRQAR